jgi:hypothetical protein
VPPAAALRAVLSVSTAEVSLAAGEDKLAQAGGSPLVLHRNVALYRLAHGSATGQAHQVSGPLRLLVAIASPETDGARSSPMSRTSDRPKPHPRLQPRRQPVTLGKMFHGERRDVTATRRQGRWHRKPRTRHDREQQDASG